MRRLLTPPQSRLTLKVAGPAGCGTGVSPVRREQPERLIVFYGIGSAVVAEITIYLLGLFLAHERLENLLAVFCFLGEIAHFLEFSSTADSAEQNHLRLLLPFGVEVFSVATGKKISRFKSSQSVCTRKGWNVWPRLFERRERRRRD